MFNQFVIRIAALCGLTLGLQGANALLCKDLIGFVPRRQALMKPGKMVVVTPGKDYDITVTGDNFGIHVAYDEGRFCYTELEGDFSIQVQVTQIVPGDSANQVLWGSAGGLCIRKTLDSGSIFYAIRASHGNAGLPTVDPRTLT